MLSDLVTLTRSMPVLSNRMSRANLLALTLFLTPPCWMYSQNARITFQVVTPTTIPSAENVFVTGNDSTLGLWNPGKVSLAKYDDSTWIGEFLFPRGKELEFKFTRGTWNTQAIYEAGVIPANSRLTVRNDTVILIRPLSWIDEMTPQEEGITGTVHYVRDLRGDGLAYDRDLIVWLPPSYEQDSSKHYPVLYMQDGQNIIDPRTSFAGYDWRVDETCDSLIRNRKMREIIVVGIYNSPDRMTEYSNSEVGHTYARFVANVVKPLIDSTYRTLPERENTAVMGSSLGGLISFLLAWWYPHVFSKAACLSPVLSYNQEATFKEVESDTSKARGIKIYIDCGGIGAEATLKPGVDRMAHLLDTQGFKKGVNYVSFYDGTAEHNERAWAARLWRPLMFFFGTDN